MTDTERISLINTIHECMYQTEVLECQLYDIGAGITDKNRVNTIRNSIQGIYNSLIGGKR